MKEFNKVVGLTGEQKAVEFLKTKKYKILEMNYKNKIGEIDIIASKKDYIVFVEVKARETRMFGSPCEAVGKLKQQKIRKTAQVYLLQKKLFDFPCQFDVIEIVGEQIYHIENCF